MENSTRFLIGVVGVGTLGFFIHPWLFPRTGTATKDTKTRPSVKNLVNNIKQGIGPDQAYIDSVKAEKLQIKKESQPPITNAYQWDAPENVKDLPYWGDVASKALDKEKKTGEFLASIGGFSGSQYYYPNAERILMIKYAIENGLMDKPTTPPTVQYASFTEDERRWQEFR